MVRSVITTVNQKRGNVIFRVPRKYWFTYDHGFKQRHRKLYNAKSMVCGGKKTSVPKTFVLAAGLALEKKLGKKSQYYKFMQNLPKSMDYREFLPQAASPSTLADFGSMREARVARTRQEQDKRNWRCFRNLRRSIPKLFKITWEDFEEALMQWRTRCYGIHGEGQIGTMVPGSDMLNVAEEPEINTHWNPDIDILNPSLEDMFEVKMTADAAAGSELYEGYCVKCHNSPLLQIWGVYLERNRFPLNPAAAPDCNAKVTNGTAQTLREAALAMLNMSDFSNDWNSPRCKSPDQWRGVDRDQGPLRCSFARLAWEYCGERWVNAMAAERTASKSSQLQLGAVPKASFFQVGVAQPLLDIEEEAALLDRSSIRNVHPALLPLEKENERSVSVLHHGAFTS